jgi:hypothetical protein
MYELRCFKRVRLQRQGLKLSINIVYRTDGQIEPSEAFGPMTDIQYTDGQASFFVWFTVASTCDKLVYSNV